MSDSLNRVQNQVEQISGPNDVLVGHTTICEAARLVSGTEPSIEAYFPPRPILRLLELCALTEAAVLHDTLFTLPAELPSDVDNLQLRTSLLESGVLKEYSSPVLLKEVMSTLIKWISSNTEEASKEGSYPFGSYSGGYIPHLTTDLARLVDRSGVDSPSSGYINDFNVAGPLRIDPWNQVTYLVKKIQEGNLFGKAGVLKNIGVDIGSGMDYGFSGAYEDSLIKLRHIIYWQVADRAHLPWYPDVLRVPLMVVLNQRLRSSLVDQVYSVVAQALDTTVDELLVEDLPYEAVIPPLGALLLSRSSKREDVADNLLTLRDEFADFRRTFRELEQQRRNAQSIKELRDVRAKATSLLKAVASKYNEPDQSIIETVIGYAPDVLNVMASPLDPSRYKSELLKKTYEWIRDWWYRRPASRLFSVTKKLETLKLYGQLAPRVFGIEITSDDATFIREYNAKMRLLLAPSQSNKRKTS